jgi:hypothetical protein
MKQTRARGDQMRAAIVQAIRTLGARHYRPSEGGFLAVHGAGYELLPLAQATLPTPVQPRAAAESVATVDGVAYYCLGGVPVMSMKALHGAAVRAGRPPGPATGVQVPVRLPLAAQ